MALTRAEMVRETTTTTGTGTYTLGGAATGFQGFVAGAGTGATVRYMCTDGTSWEVGEGVVTTGSPDTLTRATIIASSNAGSAVSWPDTTAKDISLVLTADEVQDINSEIVQILVFDYTATVTTGDGKAYFHVPSKMDGMNLVEVHAEVITAGTTGTTDVQIHNVDNALDMLSTALTIDSAETGSDTAATAAVIDTANDHVNTNDVIRIDVDAVSTTAPIGLIVTLEFRLP